MPLDSKRQWTLNWQLENMAPPLRSEGAWKTVREYWSRFRRLDLLLELTSDETTILDVGCGLATVLNLLPGKRIGLDPLATAYQEALPYSEALTIHQGRGEAIPLEADSVDLVICSNCLDHTDAPAQVLSEVARVLRPNGHFLLTCEVKDPRKQRNAGHPHSLSAEQLQALIMDWHVLEPWISPWIGVAPYLRGVRSSTKHEHGYLLTHG